MRRPGARNRRRLNQDNRVLPTRVRTNGELADFLYDRLHHLADLSGDRFQRFVVDGCHRSQRVDGTDFHPVVDRPQDDITGQHGTDPGFDSDRLVSHVRIAGAEDLVGIHVGIDFLFHRRLDVDLGQHAETVSGQCRASPVVDRFEVGILDNSVDGIAQVF